MVNVFFFKTSACDGLLNGLITVKPKKTCKTWEVGIHRQHLLGDFNDVCN